MKGFDIDALTEKEQVVLSLWVCGQTAKETALVLNKSNRTIEFHREKIKCKLGVYCARELRIKLLTSKEFDAILSNGKNLIKKNIYYSKEKFNFLSV